MNIKEQIFNFISSHEAQISHDMKQKDDMIKVRFTTFGNRAGCKALYEVIQMLDDDMKLKVVEMMKSKLNTHEEHLDIPVVIRKGFVQAMNGNELWVNTETDEIVKFVVKDRETQRNLYCKHVKITIEVIDEEHILSNTKNKKCRAKKGDYPCTIWGCSWCNDCKLYK